MEWFMAPRAPETFAHLVTRLRRAAAEGRRQVPFQSRGMAHFTHVVVVEDGRWRLRRWLLDPQKAEAYLKAHGHFMPEDAEAISEPGPEILLEADDVEAFIAALGARDLV
jgi:hypothetical protein